ncbi:hypothetical protein [Vagococcus carniphilus]|uniref:hypothetical protein n=1 Tax=Vagococcus carniphilus TaxID=218144 RepID=UPI003B58C2BF
MMHFKKNKNSAISDLITDKLTIVLEQDVKDKRKDILSFFDSVDTANFYAIMGRKNSMLPFLTVEDNILLGMSKKQQKEFLLELDDAILTFRLDPKCLKQISSSLSDYDQMIFQIIRALILKQNIIIFDTYNSKNDTSVFLLNLMPILKSYTKLNQATALIVTPNVELAKSNYYDQCVLLDHLYHLN